MKAAGIDTATERPAKREDEFYRPNEISQTMKNLGGGVEINTRR